MAERIKLPIPTGELLPAEERLGNVLKAISDRLLYERAEWNTMQDELQQGWPHTDEAMERQRSFMSGLDIAWSLAKTEIVRRTDSP